jgi:stress-induced-phosphoprotein 1
LGDPLMQQILQDLRNDPKSMQQHMRDPQIRANIEKLYTAGVLH